MTDDNVHYIAKAKPGVASNGDAVIPSEFLGQWLSDCGDKYDFYGPFVLSKVKGKFYLPFDKTNEERIKELSQAR